MVIADLIGRLGNNLFQISASVGYASKYNVDYDIPPWEYSNCFNINPGHPAYDIKINYGEKSFAYEEIPFMEDVKLFGFFQSEKYFKHCEEKIRDLFQFNDRIKDKMNGKYASLINPNYTTCGVHIRRGDYVGNNFHEVCHLKYYNDAIKEIKSRINIDLFIVFSDDIAWCKENLKDEAFLFIEDNSNIDDLYLMTQCSNNIICNSSFSFWGSWLNANENKLIIAPDKWFGHENYDTKDLYCDNWILVKI